MISVVLPVYNQPSLLREALQSVQKQSLKDIEVVVIDDGSEADISNIVNRFGKWARHIRHEESQGAAAARNTGIKHANGKFIAFLDADDLWKPTKLEKQLSVFENADDNVGLVYTGFIQYEIDGTEWKRYPEARGSIYVDELERDRIHPTSTVMIRQNILEEVGGFDTELPSRQDYDLWLRLTEHYKVDYVDEILVDKREQPDSISKDFESRIEGDHAVFEKVKKRSAELNLYTRSRIHSYHHHVIGRDYESNGERWKALKHLSLAILRYPVRPVSWAMFIITLFGINRNGKIFNYIKKYIR